MSFFETCIQECKDKRAEKKRIYPVGIFLYADGHKESLDLSTPTKEIALRRLVKKIKDTDPSEVCFMAEATMWIMALNQNMEQVDPEEIEDEKVREFMENVNGKEILIVNYENNKGESETTFHQVHAVGDAVEFLDYSSKDLEHKGDLIPALFNNVFEKAEEWKKKPWWELNW